MPVRFWIAAFHAGEPRDIAHQNVIPELFASSTLDAGLHRLLAFVAVVAGSQSLFVLIGLSIGPMLLG
jgi:hypothetical protein